MTWDLNDIRHFLAVARTGSTLAASKTLAVNQTTCARRIAALEAALDLALFERTAAGYRTTESGAALIASAEQIEAAAVQMGRLAEELKRASRAEIRFSTSDVLADMVAGPALAHFTRAHPDIRVTLHVDSRAVDLENGEADVALRVAPARDNAKLVVRKLIDDPWGVYASAARTFDGPAPQTLVEASRYPLATMEGRATEILRRLVPGANIRYVSNSMRALVEGIKTSDCIGGLPIMIGDADPGLQRLFTLDIDGGGVWIVFHERLQTAPHIRAFVDHLAQFLRAWRQDRREDKGVAVAAIDG